MSYKTTADEKRESALNHIQEACRDLSSIVVDECDGYSGIDGFNADFRVKLQEALFELLKIKAKIE